MPNCKAKVIVIMLAVVLLLPALAGCAKQQPREILIGTAVPLTGNDSIAGAYYKNAYELAIKEVNDGGGIEVSGRKLPVRLIVYDDKSEPENSARLIERLITEDKVDALLGGHSTAIVEPQTEVAEEHRIPFVNGGGAASNIYAKGYEWIFGTLASVERLSLTLMDWVKEQQDEGKLPKPLKIAMVWENTSHGEDFQKGVRQRVADLPGNFELVLNEPFQYEGRDFTLILDKVKNADADVFLSDAHLADFILMHCQYTELGLSHRLVSYGARGSEAAARTELGSAVDYLVSCRWWSKELPYPQVEEFVNKYESTYGESPEWYAGVAYEAARALLQAINVAGSLDKAEIREALVQLEITDSLVPGQHLYFRENGQADYPFIITQSRPDGTVPIIYPADAAVTEATVTRPKVKFGCALSLSGKLEEEGHLYKEGYELWKEHILTVHSLVLLPRTLCDLFQCL